MKYRSFSFFTALFLLSAMVAPTLFANTSPNAKRAKVNQLVAMLPASDMVVTMDVTRFFGDALPGILSSDQAKLADLLSKIDAMQQKTGIDLRQFEFITAGLNVKFVSDNKYDIDAVMLARGTVSSLAVISAAKEAAANKYKEESVNGKTIFTFSMAESLAKLAEKADSEETKKEGSIIDKFLLGTSSDLAISAIDANTVAVGTPDRVHALIESRTKVGTDITNLLNRKQFSIVNFAGKVPAGLKTLIPLESDDLGESIDAIRYAYGNLDMANGQVIMGISASLETASQSEQLYDTLDTLKSFGQMLLANSKREDQRLYARLIEKVKFSRKGTEVSMDLAIPQSDVDLLVAMLTK